MKTRNAATDEEEEEDEEDVTRANCAADAFICRLLIYATAGTASRSGAIGHHCFTPT